MVGRKPKPFDLLDGVSKALRAHDPIMDVREVRAKQSGAAEGAVWVEGAADVAEGNVGDEAVGKGCRHAR